jgi:putative membrane protein
MMVGDHSKANAELTAVAQKNKLSVPGSLSSDKKAKVEKLRQESGAAFDKAYMAQMVDDHQKTAELFRMAGTHQDVNPELREFAQKTLPTIEHHKKAAEDLNAKLGGK